MFMRAEDGRDRSVDDGDEDQGVPCLPRDPGALSRLAAAQMSVRRVASRVGRRHALSWRLVAVAFPRARLAAP
ncbi:MAG: hypothetical protein PVI91_00480 [Gammaproteobacteria bacterium]|jgi:hypothetical protein